MTSRYKNKVFRNLFFDVFRRSAPFSYPCRNFDLSMNIKFVLEVCLRTFIQRRVHRQFFNILRRVLECACGCGAVKISEISEMLDIRDVREALGKPMVFALFLCA